ncbi:hypothetical protein H1R20_g7646, partial [Candolleomyces eurysporus]
MASFRIPPKLLRSLTSFSFHCDWERDPIFLTTIQHCLNVDTLALDLEDGRVQYSDSDLQCKPSEAGILFKFLRAPNIHHIDVSFERHETDLERQQYLDCTFVKAGDEDPYFECPRVSNGLPPIEEVDESFGRALGVFMDRSGSSQSTLRSLRLHYASIKAPTFSRMLERLDSLTHLTLDEFDLDGDCFKDTRVSSVLPNLQVLELLNLPPEYNLEHVDAFMGEEGDRSATLKATYRDPDLCCPMAESSRGHRVHLLRP